MRHSLATIQAALRAEGLAGWLLYDFRGSNPIALSLLAPSGPPMLTRRFLYWIPVGGEPLRFQSVVEGHLFADLPGGRRLFRSWRELERLLRDALPAGPPIAVEYSPSGALPTVSHMDAGSMEWLRGMGLTLVSSADLVQRVEAPWDEEALASHRQACRAVEALRREAVGTLREALAAGRPLLDTELQARLIAGMREAGLTSDHPPIVAFGPDSGNPHHSPDPAQPRALAPGQVVLLDIWGKRAHENAVYADYTWMAFAGDALPEAESRVWEAVRGARDALIDWLRARIAAGEAPRGCDADRIARDHIAAAGFGDFFLHRTGHNLGREDHGPGVNLDDLEARDERRIVDGMAFSIEPGIYLESFGMRTEVNALRWRGELLITGELQKSPELL